MGPKRTTRARAAAGATGPQPPNPATTIQQAASQSPVTQLNIPLNERLSIPIRDDDEATWARLIKELSEAERAAEAVVTTIGEPVLKGLEDEYRGQM